MSSKFLEYCRTNFSDSQTAFEYVPSVQPTTIVEKVVHHHHHSNYPWLWLANPQPSQNVIINNGVPASADSVKSESDDKKKDDKKKDDDFDTVTKLTLLTFGMGALGASAYYLTKDFVEYKLMQKGKKNAKVCKQELQDSNNGDNVALWGMVKNFNKMYKHRHNYFWIRILSKTGICTSAIVGLLGGLMNGPQFYDNNMIPLTWLFGGSMVTYIVNRTYYGLVHKKKDESIKNDLHRTANGLLGYPPAYNPKED